VSSVSPSAGDPRQPTSFAFDEENLRAARDYIARYPDGRQASAVLPLLDLAQRQNGGWLPAVAVAYVAEMLGMPEIRVWEVVSFYTMFITEPAGRYRLHVCTTTPCWLRGSDEVTAACKEKTGLEFGQTSADGRFSLYEVECLGACVNAPMIQVNDDYYEDLDRAKTIALIEALERDEPPPAGSMAGRRGSMAATGKTTLMNVKSAGDA